MKATDEFDIKRLPWGEILGDLHSHYYKILPEHVDQNDEMLKLLRVTQVGVKYDPRSVEADQAPANQKETTVWDGLGTEVTRHLQSILIEKYEVPEEDASTIGVGRIGVAFLSSVAPWDQCCNEWHDCASGVSILVCCPC